MPYTNENAVMTIFTQLDFFVVVAIFHSKSLSQLYVLYAAVGPFLHIDMLVILLSLEFPITVSVG